MMVVGFMEMLKCRYAKCGQFKLMVKIVQRFFGVGFKVPKCMIEVKENVLIFHPGYRFEDANIL